jgi:hypothetical protein
MSEAFMAVKLRPRGDPRPEPANVVFFETTAKEEARTRETGSPAPSRVGA